MTSTCLKPTLNSICGVSRLSKYKRLSVQKNKQNLIKPFLASICFLLCIVVVPEKPNSQESICEKYNSSIACQVW